MDGVKGEEHIIVLSVFNFWCLLYWLYCLFCLWLLRYKHIGTKNYLLWFILSRAFVSHVTYHL